MYTQQPYTHIPNHFDRAPPATCLLLSAFPPSEEEGGLKGTQTRQCLCSPRHPPFSFALSLAAGLFEELNKCRKHHYHTNSHS